MSEVTVEVGKRIRAARLTRAWSQADLAQRTARTQTAISYWESGSREIGIGDLIELASTLGVPASTLLPGTAYAEPGKVADELVIAAINGHMARWVGPWIREDVARAVLEAVMPLITPDAPGRAGEAQEDTILRGRE